MASSSALTTKQQVGLDMMSEVLEGDFGAAFGVLVKVLGNLVANPDDAKYRKLRTSNAKVQAMLATKGVRALLVGSGAAPQIKGRVACSAAPPPRASPPPAARLPGFVEEPDALNAETADVAAVQAGLEGLQALQVTRASQHGQSAPLAVPQLGSCASSGRAWRLWAARHSQEEVGSLGAPPPPRVLEPAASKAAHFTAPDHSGGP